MDTILKYIVSKSQIKKVGLTGNETVEKLNPWAKGQRNHKDNTFRHIYDEKGNMTAYCVKRTMKGNVIVYAV